MAEKSSVFDMIGPIMIGPSSSHTAGVVRIGRVGFRLLGTKPKNADITFYNSFARTYEGHGSDRAIISGLLDFRTDDTRIKEAFDHAKDVGMTWSFRPVGNASTMHPNTIKLVISNDVKTVTYIGESRGGGLIKIAEVNGFNSIFNARNHTMIITANDVKGSIAFITNVLLQDECNIATMTVSRKGKNDMACLILEMDSGPRLPTLEYLKQLKWVKEVMYIPDIDL
jgi:L-serine dehydratase